MAHEDRAMVPGELKSLRITLEAVETGVLGYVYLKDVDRGQAARTVEIEPGSVMADYDSQGRLLGVELLNADRADGELMRRLAQQLKAPELAGLDLAQMCRTPA